MKDYMLIKREMSPTVWVMLNLVTILVPSARRIWIVVTGSFGFASATGTVAAAAGGAA